MSGVHPTAIVARQALLGEAVEVGPYTVIHGNVSIGARTRIGPFCEIGVPTTLGDGSPLIVGEDAQIRSHCVFYESSSFGAGLVTGHHAARELTRAGRNLQMGSASDIQGDCEIGDFVRLHRGVHVGKRSRIGSFVWLFPDVLFTNDPNPPSDDWRGPVVEDFAVVCARVTLLPGVRIGAGSVILPQSLVGIDVPAETIASGTPAVLRGPASLLRMKGDARKRAYPWRARFTRGYPDAVVASWGPGSDTPDAPEG